MTITRYIELSVSEEIACKGENHNFASKKYVSQTSYQALQTTKMNFEKLLDQQVFKNHIAIKLSSVPFCVLAVLFIQSCKVLSVFFHVSLNLVIFFIV